MMRHETKRRKFENGTALGSSALIVENDEFGRDLMVRQLSHAGFAVAVAGSGHQALEVLDCQFFDMIFLSPVLPDMNGTELLTVIRQRYSSAELPVIAIATADAREMAAACLQAGANDCITKPFEPDVLSSCIEVHMDARRPRKVMDSCENAEKSGLVGNMPAEILDAIGERFVLWDSGDRLVACNQRYRELFGRNADQVLPGTRFECLAALLAHGGLLRNASEKPDAWLAERLTRHRESGGPIEEEFTDGSWVRITEHRTATGQVIGLWTDITAVKRREIALKNFAETNRRLAAAINATNSAVLITDARRTGNPTIFANPAFAAMTGWPVEEALGRDRKFLAGPETDANMTARIDSQMAAGLAVTTELRLRTRTGRAFWAEINASPIRDRESRIVNWVIIQTDISARKQSEERFRQSQKMEAVGQLTSGLAHDFNNLLTIILGNLETVLNGEPKLTGAARAGLQAAFDATSRGSELTTRMLAFARRQSWSPSETEIGRTVTNLRDLLARSLGPSIQVETILGENLWPVLVDRVQLENAILNLAVNARDAMPKGGTLTIEAANISPGARDEMAAGDYTRISVADTGVGMTPGTVARAAQPFFTTKPTGEGTGLGLSMVQGLASESAGYMRIDSAQGSGTRVELYLPRMAGETNHEGAGTHEPLTTGREVILLVDDEPQIRAVTAIQLKRLGYEVLQAEDGPAALDMIESRQSVDLLVTDIDLSGDMTGVELAASVRGQNRGIRVLYVSGYADGGWGDNQSQEARAPFLPKPYDSAALARAVRTALHAA